MTFATSAKFRRLWAFELSVLETLLIFLIIPVAVVGVVAALSLAGGGKGPEQRDRRYRPGRPYDFAPIWFLARPERVAALSGAPAQQAQAPAITSGIIEGTAGAPARPGSVGGASDRW